MPNLSLKQKIILLVLTLGTALILIFQRGIYSQEAPQANPGPTPVVHTDQPQIVSTSFASENAIISPGKPIEITFNYPLENRGEFKYKLDPETEVTIELSDDRKTAQIIPVKHFELGKSFTLTIKGGANETKFDGGKRLGQDIIYQLKTIEYRGI